MRLVHGLLLLVLCHGIGFAPAPVLADGGFIPPRVTAKDIRDRVKRGYLQEPEQHAIVHFDGKKETLYLSVRYEGNVDEFAWIIPVPAKPTIELAPPGLVHDIAEFEYRLELEEWKRFGDTEGETTIGGGGGKKVSNKPKAVTVVGRKRLGLFDIAILRAREAGALATWLNEHSFAVPDTDRAREILQHYVDANMYWCALRVETSRRTKWLNPISIQFNTDRPFYPLRISALHEHPSAGSAVAVHTFFPVDELSFRGIRRAGHPKFKEFERLFRPEDLKRCVAAFPALRDGAYSLVTFKAAAVRPEEMRDLWFAITEEHSKEVEAEIASHAFQDRSNSELLAYLAEFPASKWAVEARAELEKRGGGDPELGAGVLLVRAGRASDEERFREAVETYRIAARVGPSEAKRARDLERVALHKEEKLAEEYWSNVMKTKEKALETRDARKYFQQLVTLMALCKDVHPEKSFFDFDLKARFSERCQGEMAWLERHHAHQLNRKLWKTYEGLDWYVRREPSKAYEECLLLLSLSPDSAVGKKAREYSLRMRRGLRAP